MTMIMGVNLTDQIYLAGDTRVTYELPPNLKFKDNIIKLTAFSDKQDCKLAVAVAGDVQFAAFLSGRLAHDLKFNLFPLKLTHLQANLEDFFASCISDWIKQRGLRPNVMAYLMIGAIDYTTQTHLQKEKVEELLKSFEIHVEDQRKGRERVIDALANDSEMQQLNSKIMRDKGVSLLEMFEENMRPRFNPKIEAILKGNTNLENQPHTSLLAGYSVDANKGTVEVETASWGQGLVKGGGVRPDALQPDMQAAFEFGTRQQQGDNSHMLECAIIGRTILDYASKNRLPTIGGSVAVGILSKNGMLLSGQNFRFDGPKIFAKINETEIPMKYFYELGGMGGLLHFSAL